ncbi:MAG: hypothetical protein RBU37_15685 [Myxococcota bacterium]|nr:hypothetical protein [Myxococcota bacterium]
MSRERNKYKQVGKQAKRPIDKKLGKTGQAPNRQEVGKQAKRPIDKNSVEILDPGV